MRATSSPLWLGAFLDLPADEHEAGLAFWSGVTGYAVSAPRGAAGEFVALVPPDGDAFLKVQRIDSAVARLHLDLYIDDPDAATQHAASLGAVVLERSEHGFVVLRSPGGLTFCFVDHQASTVPAPLSWPGVARSRVYQVTLDIPATAYDEECGFWARVLDGGREVLRRRPEFARVPTERTHALGLLLQRLEQAVGPVTAHLDLGTPDRAAEVARHVTLGATVRAEEEFWTVLTDPTGLPYCVTDRDPATGRLA